MTHCVAASPSWREPPVTSAQLVREYGFTDVDGTQPDSWALH